MPIVGCNFGNFHQDKVAVNADASEDKKNLDFVTIGKSRGGRDPEGKAGKAIFSMWLFSMTSGNQHQELVNE